MGEIKVTLSANAGVCIEAAGKKIWVDVLHNSPVKSFSTLNPELCEWVFSWEEPDCILYTHCHPDHYSRELTKHAIEKWPEAKLVLPRQDFENQFLLCRQKHKLEIGELSIEFIRLPHEGEEFSDVSHYGLLVESSEGNVLLPGDCALASPALLDAIAGRSIDVAILDFPWITLRKGQQFILEHIQPKHILAYHLPFAEDDCNGYRNSAVRMEKTIKNVDIRLLCNPKQIEVINN